MKPNLATCCFVLATVLPSLATAQTVDADAAPAQSPSPVQDTAIEARIKDRLAEERTVDLAQVKVAAAQEGTVVLSGKVETRAAEEKAVSIARDTPGVKMVTSSIQIITKD